eukprot:XP_001693814.1 predicted protein [Chlamydomonas reinhardtii]
MPIGYLSHRLARSGSAGGTTNMQSASASTAQQQQPVASPRASKLLANEFIAAEAAVTSSNLLCAPPASHEPGVIPTPPVSACGSAGQHPSVGGAAAEEAWHGHAALHAVAEEAEEAPCATSGLRLSHADSDPHEPPPPSGACSPPQLPGSPRGGRSGGLPASILLGAAGLSGVPLPPASFLAAPESAGESPPAAGTHLWRRRGLEPQSDGGVLIGSVGLDAVEAAAAAPGLPPPGHGRVGAIIARLGGSSRSMGGCSGSRRSLMAVVDEAAEGPRAPLAATRSRIPRPLPPTAAAIATALIDGQAGAGPHQKKVVVPPLRLGALTAAAGLPVTANNGNFTVDAASPAESALSPLTPSGLLPAASDYSPKGPGSARRSRIPTAPSVDASSFAASPLGAGGSTAAASLRSSVPSAIARKASAAPMAAVSTTSRPQTRAVGAACASSYARGGSGGGPVSSSTSTIRKSLLVATAPSKAEAAASTDMPLLRSEVATAATSIKQIPSLNSPREGQPGPSVRASFAAAPSSLGANPSPRTATATGSRIPTASPRPATRQRVPALLPALVLPQAGGESACSDAAATARTLLAPGTGGGNYGAAASPAPSVPPLLTGASPPFGTPSRPGAGGWSPGSSPFANGGGSACSSSGRGRPQLRSPRCMSPVPQLPLSPGGRLVHGAPMSPGDEMPMASPDPLACVTSRKRLLAGAGGHADDGAEGKARRGLALAFDGEAGEVDGTLLLCGGAWARREAGAAKAWRGLAPCPSRRQTEVARGEEDGESSAAQALALAGLPEEAQPCNAAATTPTTTSRSCGGASGPVAASLPVAAHQHQQQRYDAEDEAQVLLASVECLPQQQQQHRRPTPADVSTPSGAATLRTRHRRVDSRYSDGDGLCLASPSFGAAPATSAGAATYVPEEAMLLLPSPPAEAVAAAAEPEAPPQVTLLQAGESLQVAGVASAAASGELVTSGSVAADATTTPRGMSRFYGLSTPLRPQATALQATSLAVRSADGAATAVGLMAASRQALLQAVSEATGSQAGASVQASSALVDQAAAFVARRRALLQRISAVAAADAAIAAHASAASAVDMSALVARRSAMLATLSHATAEGAAAAVSAAAAEHDACVVMAAELAQQRELERAAVEAAAAAAARLAADLEEAGRASGAAAFTSHPRLWLHESDRLLAEGNGRTHSKGSSRCMQRNVPSVNQVRKNSAITAGLAAGLFLAVRPPAMPRASPRPRVA